MQPEPQQKALGETVKGLQPDALQVGADQGLSLLAEEAGIRYVKCVRRIPTVMALQRSCQLGPLGAHRIKVDTGSPTRNPWHLLSPRLSHHLLLGR